MKAEVIEHITSEGDRWDLLAWQYYGDPTLYEPIVVANPEVPITPILPSGIRLLIPIIDDSEMIGPEGLPPWKT